MLFRSKRLVPYPETELFYNYLKINPGDSECHPGFYPGNWAGTRERDYYDILNKPFEYNNCSTEILV